MGNLCVVAIPSEDDYVWKISSEKVPHMTILYLGDVAEVQNFAKIASYIQHAAGTSLRRFGLEVDHRGVLGQDEADVLFFSWDKWSGIQDVTNFRNYLLQDGNIRTSYDSVEQHDGFYPHLTLGYPPTPAKPDDRDYPGINYVQFDKVALWFGDYTGLEFPLKTRSMDYAEVSMDNIREDRSALVERILEHHGTKGMKWGNRKNSIPAATGGGRQVRVTEHIDRVGKVRLKAEGGEGRPAHIDALSAAAAKQKLTKSGIHSLSNKELQDLTTRMNLEQNVGRLSSSGKSATSKFVTSTLQNVAKQQIAKLATDAASGQVENLLNKK